MTKGVGEEIPFEVMLAYYSDEAAAKLGGAPPVDQVLRPRVMRSQSGRPVSVSVWKPKVTPKAE